MFLFTPDGNDAQVSTGELDEIALLSNTGDFGIPVPVTTVLTDDFFAV